MEKEAGEDIKHNNEKWRDKAAKLRERGAFRIPLPRAPWESIEAPKFDGKVHQVRALIGGLVEDTEGHRYPVKQVLAVPKNSEEYKLPEELFPNAARRGVQKEALKGYADEITRRFEAPKTSNFHLR